MVDRPVGMDPIQNGQRKWTVSIDGEEILNLQNRKMSEVDEEQWVRIRNTAAAVLCQCPNPNAANTTGRGCPSAGRHR